jgi:hypothetical protein
MSVGSLFLRFTVAASPSEIVAYVTDPAHYIGLNPYVTEVTDIRRRDGAVEFRAVERVRLFGPVQRNNPLHLVVRSEADTRVVYDVTSPGGIAVRIATELARVDGRTDVQDTITLTVPWPARRFALRQARFAQEYRAGVLGRLGEL